MKVCRDRVKGLVLREIFEFFRFYINAECWHKSTLLLSGNCGFSVNVLT